jgi:hypothetical protein
VDQLVGHCVHEVRPLFFAFLPHEANPLLPQDAPARTAETLLSFLERNDRTDADKKLKELLARKALAQAEAGGLV